MNWRLPAAFLVSPVVPCALYAVPDLVMWRNWAGARVTLVVGVVVAEAMVVVLALPTYLVLRRYRTVGLRSCLCAGFLICFGTSCVLQVISLNPGYSASDGGGATIVNGHLTAHGFVMSIVGATIFGIMGALTGLIFWLVGIYRRPSNAVRV